MWIWNTFQDVDHRVRESQLPIPLLETPVTPRPSRMHTFWQLYSVGPKWSMPMLLVILKWAASHWLEYCWISWAFLNRCHRIGHYFFKLTCPFRWISNLFGINDCDLRDCFLPSQIQWNLLKLSLISDKVSSCVRQGRWSKGQKMMLATSKINNDTPKRYIGELMDEICPVKPSVWMVWPTR